MNKHMICRVMMVGILALLFGRTGQATAVPFSIKLTAQGLGLGSSDINKGATVDPDLAGFVTSSGIGEGSILTIQTDGLAGDGTGSDPVLVTVTATEHLDTVSGLPTPNDYQAGVLFISAEKPDLPDGRREGLGVRAFTVDGATALRVFDGGLAVLEGSKHVSGGTGSAVYDPSGPNGAPHVDEAVHFNFNNPSSNVNARDIAVLLSDFDPADIIDLDILLKSGGTSSFSFFGPQNTPTTVFEEVGDKLWKLKFSGLSVLGPTDVIDKFVIRANDDNPSDPKGTAEHFFITGITGEYEANLIPQPEPGTILLLGTGLVGLIGYGWRRKRQVA